jgi:hypothetical protein
VQEKMVVPLLCLLRATVREWNRKDLSDQGGSQTVRTSREWAALLLKGNALSALKGPSRFQLKVMIRASTRAPAPTALRDVARRVPATQIVQHDAYERPAVRRNTNPRLSQTLISCEMIGTRNLPDERGPRQLNRRCYRRPAHF